MIDKTVEIKYLSRLQPWIYYVFVILVTATFWLRPALVSLYDFLYGPSLGDAFLRVNGVYFPILWILYVAYIVTFFISLKFVIKVGGVKHWLFMIISAIFITYYTIYLVIFNGVPGGIIG